MTTKVKDGYKIMDNFSLLAVCPDDTLAGSELIEFTKHHGCSYLTLLPFPPNQNSPKGGVVLFASPYPVTVEEAKELEQEWSKEAAKKFKK